METLSWLAKNPRYTKRFALSVGKLCRSATNKDVATLLRLSPHTVKDLDKVYMGEQVRREQQPAPEAIGVDEISVGRGQTYRVVVSDIERGRVIWMGGKGREEKDLEEFFRWLGPKKAAAIRVAVMDMWRPFRNVVNRCAPQAAVVFDKFHIMRHLHDELDDVRRSEYRRLCGRDRDYIKGQRYVLLSHRANLDASGKASLAQLLKANKRLQKAYLLKESFGQLWGYRTEAGARAFFDRWKESLKWQRLGPYEKFARMIERHWAGIASYCRPENKVSLGFVEAVNNKIRVLQRSAYGYRDEEYLQLKVITSFLPALPGV